VIPYSNSSNTHEHDSLSRSSNDQLAERHVLIPILTILPLLFTLLLSLLITRIAAMAFMLTGMSREMARFQARSAFTGVGFTTAESEDIVSHPLRRRIAMTLMLLGNVGIATVLATTILPLLQFRESQGNGYMFAALVGGLVILWFFATNRRVERHLNRFISYGLRKWGHLEVRDYVAILQLQKGYAVTELLVEPQDWLAGKTLIELRLPAEGVLVLGVQRSGGTYLGAPTSDTEVRAEDTLVLYGPIHRLDELDQRRQGHRGEEAHQEAVEEQEDVLEEQEQHDDDPN
jgi:hypothetical protein